MELVLELSERLMRCPAAPYHESLVAQEVVRICSENALDHEIDPFGNILVRSLSSANGRAIVFAAHMDHPGFVIRKRLSPQKFLAEFLGGVGDAYFKRGVPVLLMPGRVKAKILRRTDQKKRLFELSCIEQVNAEPSYAVWDLADFTADKKHLRGRVCDDLIGVAAALAAVIEAKHSRTNAIAAISRAEEVGFQGALALAQTKTLPQDALVISLETSRELPSVKMGAGVIIRTGDRSSIFNSDASRFLHECALDLQKREPKFEFQRALMSGGTCEATAYQEYGYQTAAVCVALGNYHNCAPKNKIAEEFVSRVDAISMTRLLVEAAAQMPNFPDLVARLPKRLEQYAKDGTRLLKEHPLKL